MLSKQQKSSDSYCNLASPALHSLQIDEDRVAAARGTAQESRNARKRAQEEKQAAWAADIMTERARNAVERQVRLAEVEASRVQVRSCRL